jgi:asparagine synthase (glutamine-hydrolysing)
MCAILGVFSLNHRVSNHTVVSMSESMKHRGSDNSQFWSNADENVVVGHRRLSIIDLSSTGVQPMISYNSRFIIVFNGEIYNYQELAIELEKTGVKGDWKSDTRVLLEGYSTFGNDFLQKLDGMFAFVIYDVVEHSFFCARDRFGEKPLFYTIDNGCFYFASEIKAFWSINLRKQIREEALFDYAYSNSVTNGEELEYTFFEDVFKLKPGETMRVSENGSYFNLRKKKFWELAIPNKSSLSYNDAKDSLNDLLKDSIKLRLRADVPIGVSLSGGVDSSLIGALIKELSDIEQITSFSARFRDFGKDEGRNIALINEVLKYANVSIYPTEDQLIDDFDRICFHHDEPFRSTNMYSQYKVMATAAHYGVKVMLNGQGADEIFAGYWFYREAYYNQLKNLDKLQYEKMRIIDPGVFNDTSGNIMSRLIKHAPKIAQEMKYIKEFLNGFRYSKNFQRDFFHKHKHRINKFDNRKSLKETMISHINNGLLEELLRYDDRNSMAHTVEVRLPFLDHNIVEFALSLPDDFLINSGMGKYILRDINSKYLPGEISWDRNKIGFATPNSSLLRKRLITNNKLDFSKYFSDKILLEEFKVSLYTLCRF